MGYIRRSNINLLLASAISVLGIVVFCAPTALAENFNIDAVKGIQISPTIVELNATRGDTYKLTIKITNVTSSDLSYVSSVDDFVADGETGSSKIIRDNNLSATASLKTWISNIPQFSLQPHESTNVTVNIIIPENAEPGGHYGELRFYQKSPDIAAGNSVGLSISAGVLLLVRVDGAINEKASLASFYTSRGDTSSFFFEDSPITFVTRIRNEGNIHIKPVGSIEVKDILGNVVADVKVNDKKSNVLPNSIRRFESELNKKWMIGRYTANLALGYGTKGKTIVGSIDFWVIPYKFLTVALLSVVTIIFILSRLIKMYNRHVIDEFRDEKLVKRQHKKKRAKKDKKQKK